MDTLYHVKIVSLRAELGSSIVVQDHAVNHRLFSVAIVSKNDLLTLRRSYGSYLLTTFVNTWRIGPTFLDRLYYWTFDLIYLDFDLSLDHAFLRWLFCRLCVYEFVVYHKHRVLILIMLLYREFLCVLHLFYCLFKYFSLKLTAFGALWTSGCVDVYATCTIIEILTRVFEGWYGLFDDLFLALGGTVNHRNHFGRRI